MNTNGSIFRIDTFKVSNHAKDELLNAIKKMHAFLREIPGCLKDDILVESTNTESIKIITILEWLNEESAKNASNLVRDMQWKENFKPQEIIKKNNIITEISYLKKVNF